MSSCAKSPGLFLTFLATVFALSLAGLWAMGVTLSSWLFEALFPTQCCLFLTLEMLFSTAY
jgi:hypothetical protein